MCAEYELSTRMRYVKAAWNGQARTCWATVMMASNEAKVECLFCTGGTKQGGWGGLLVLHSYFLKKKLV